MENYLNQLLEDIREATENLSFPEKSGASDLSDWLSPEEEDATAPERNLPEWTGIKPEMLPPADMLNDVSIHVLLEALKNLLDACNCHFVLQTAVPEAIQYETIRLNVDQQVKLRQWHMGLFAMCKPGTVHGTCALGDYCQCAFFDQFFDRMTDEGLSPEEERARALDIEIEHIKRRYGPDWMKYYPYHLDKNFDDENGNPYNYRFNTQDEEDDEDIWWRK